VEIFVTLRPEERQGTAWNLQLTDFQSISYDPVWSPVEDRIVFVSQALKSDDIWIINADGTDAQPLTENVWEWDKHPSWSPDGKQIVFWSNRTGVMQIYIMDVDSVNKWDPDREKAVNISESDWDEYDPLWIK
jgi:dipeptidyl aminopeptidase/acylaminoacyl peptidase